MTLDIIVAIVLFLFMLMSFFPTLPGIPAMFIVTIIYGFIDRFDALEPWHFAVFAAITALSMLTDFFSGLIGAKLGGATQKSLLIGSITTLIGLFFFPPFGAFIGLFLGVLGAELWQYKTHMQALKSAGASVAAAIIGALCNVFLAIAYFVIFLLAVFWL